MVLCNIESNIRVQCVNPLHDATDNTDQNGESSRDTELPADFALSRTEFHRCDPAIESYFSFNSANEKKIIME